MAGAPARRRFELAKVDSWLAVLQWAWDRAYALIASTAGAAVMGYLAKATGWIAQYGPIAWGGIGLLAFLLIYCVLVWGRGRLAKARMERAAAMVTERAAEHATVNPLAPDFRNQRIRLVDLYTPYGLPIDERSFKDCDLIGPAVLWLSPYTVFRNNTFHNVEFIKIDANTARQWPNKLALTGGGVERCRLVNVIILVHADHAPNFEALFTGPIQWMNDPIPPTEVPKLPSPPDTEQETPQ